MKSSSVPLDLKSKPSERSELSSPAATRTRLARRRSLPSPLRRHRSSSKRSPFRTSCSAWSATSCWATPWSFPAAATATVTTVSHAASCSSSWRNRILFIELAISILDAGIRTALLDSDQHSCPSCSQSDVSPDSLIANKFLRKVDYHYPCFTLTAA